MYKTQYVSNRGQWVLGPKFVYKASPKEKLSGSDNLVSWQANVRVLYELLTS